MGLSVVVRYAIEGSGDGKQRQHDPLQDSVLPW
jgi:hypothetical protein